MKTKILNTNSSIRIAGETDTSVSFDHFFNEISKHIPATRIYRDEMRRLAWGTDAGFYRLIPQIVIQSESEEEIVHILREASIHRLGVTFRAAGTSLSGQAISDSILVIAGKNWENYSFNKDASIITLQPGITGGRIQELLKPYNRRFTPDPASLKSAMLGGIVMNNASGMSCGIHANSDRMMVGARIILPDGTILDTANAASRQAFRMSHGVMLQKIEAIRDEIQLDSELKALLLRKYSIKNVTGLNLLPFLRFDDPFDIIAHIMTGSEGTLAFLAEASFQTAPINPFRASALVCFTDLNEACKAVQLLKKQTPWAVELFDRKALHAMEQAEHIPEYLLRLNEKSAALLIEVQATTQDELKQQTEAIEHTLQGFDLQAPYCFLDKEADFAPLWNLRAGIFPACGGMREPGTTTLIEDIAFPIDTLPEATVALQQLIEKYGYHDGVIYGHALEGNFHFILNQRFDQPQEIARYKNLMEEVVTLVVARHKGSLKAEHGTGRNMAPFVQLEWGDKVWALMHRIKQLFDPFGIMNPGVIFNDDPNCYLKNLKPLPLTHPLIDKCIECGFCEINCVTAGLTLSARQRIVVTREINRIKTIPEETERLKQLKKQFRYAGEQTCAGDGLCATSCPMKINTGELVHLLRQKRNDSAITQLAGKWSAEHLAEIKSGVRTLLYTADKVHQWVGSNTMEYVCNTLHIKTGKKIPLWTPAMPQPFKFKAYIPLHHHHTRKVVYFPSCINQTFGTSDKDTPALMKVFTEVLEKANYQVIFPENMENLCCGTIWESKGMPEIAQKKTTELENALWQASEGGKYPIVCDQSPCLYRMRKEFKRLHAYETVEFINLFVVDHLTFFSKKESIALHITCSTRKMGLANDLIALAYKCSHTVFIPEEVGCCGFAGDKGFTHPEVNRYALRKLKPQLQNMNISEGYSNSRTCEIGLTTNTEIPYKSIIYLVNECTTQNA